MPTVQELRAEKADLETTIFEAIRDFEERHSVSISYVSIDCASNELNPSSTESVSVVVTL